MPTSAGTSMRSWRSIASSAIPVWLSRPRRAKVLKASCLNFVTGQRSSAATAEWASPPSSIASSPQPKLKQLSSAWLTIKVSTQQLSPKCMTCQRAAASSIPRESAVSVLSTSSPRRSATISGKSFRWGATADSVIALTPMSRAVLFLPLSIVTK